MGGTTGDHGSGGRLATSWFGGMGNPFVVCLFLSKHCLFVFSFSARDGEPLRKSYSVAIWFLSPAISSTILLISLSGVAAASELLFFLS